MIRREYVTLDGRTVALELSPAIGFALAANHVAEELAELVAGSAGVYVETSRRGTEATLCGESGEWSRVDLDAFFDRCLRDDAIATIRAARSRPEYVAWRVPA